MLSQTIGFHRDPLAFLRAGQVEFGDVFTTHGLRSRGAGDKDGPAAVARQGLKARMCGKEEAVAGPLKDVVQTAVAEPGSDG